MPEEKMRVDTAESAGKLQPKVRALIKTLTDYREFGLLMAFGVLLVAAAFITPGMFAPDSIAAMFRNYSVYGIMAVGMMAVILTGGIDLSIGSTLALSGIFASQLIMGGAPVWLCVVTAVIVGGICGVVNGLLVGAFKMLPMIATLSTMYVYRGVAYVVSGGAWLMPHQFTPEYTNVAGGKTLGMFNILWIVVAVLVIASVFFSKTRPGRRIYAVGSSPVSTKIIGIRTWLVIVMAYAIMGVLAGLCGFLYTANYAVWEPAVGSGMEMDVIAICILGGVSINGGVGKIGGITISMLMMSVISYFLSMLPGMSVWKMAIQGGIIIVAVAVNILTGKFAEVRALKARVI